jgi:fermentation-respiration switch protein FrsA (DUF1100 family)
MPKRPHRWRRRLKITVITLVVLLLILVYGVVPFLFSRLITSAGTRPMDRKLTETPADLGATFTDVEFPASDGVRISGWLMPSHGKNVTIIYSHGLFRSRRELLARAVDLWKLGYGALLYDSRNHGESGHAKTSLGYFERNDVEGAVSYLKGGPAAQDRIVLLGVSMGAVADLLAAAETPAVAAVVSDSAYLSLDDTVAHHIKLFFHIPAFPVANELEYFISRRAGFDAAKMSMVDAVTAIGDRPILFIAGARDRRMPPDIAQKLREAARNPNSDLLIVDGAGTAVHGHSYLTEPTLYIHKVAKFLDQIQ